MQRSGSLLSVNRDYRSSVVLFGTSGIGQQSTFSVVLPAQCPESDIEMYAVTFRECCRSGEVLQALDVAVVKEFLLELRSRRLGCWTL